jgi:hypothetical protein
MKNIATKLKLIIVLVCVFTKLTAQNNLNNFRTEKRSDSVIPNQSRNCIITKIKQDFKFYTHKVLKNFQENDLYLVAGINGSKQNITVGSYSSNFNYELSDYYKNAYKPGFFAGFRVDGKYNKIHNYSFEVLLNRYSSVTNYKDEVSLRPFMGSYSKFKSDDQLFTLSTAIYYRKLFIYGDTSKQKFYLIIGPSIDTRLSTQSLDNQINHNYHQFLLRGNVGIEFDNHSYYTLFAHYKQGITSFTKSPLYNIFNSLELGVIIKASDIF